jgi:protein-S-isoprenylcysteine O-methyltransferase Ste14
MIAAVRHSVRNAIGPDLQWVIPQVLLFTVILIGVPLSRKRNTGMEGTCALRILATATLGCCSALVASRAKRDLDDNFTMSPTPIEQGTLVTSGVYSVVRHPMYLSVLLLVAGYSCAWASRLGVLGWFGALAFLRAKIQYEERKLEQHYEHYRDYKAHVRWRLIPGVL